MARARKGNRGVTMADAGFNDFTKKGTGFLNKTVKEGEYHGVDIDLTTQSRGTAHGANEMRKSGKKVSRKPGNPKFLDSTSRSTL